MNTTSDDPSLSEAHNEHRDFDDGANALWSLYGKEAQAHDEACVQSLAKDMDGSLLFVRRYHLFLVVLNSFTYIPIGWFIFSCPRLLPCPKYSEFASGLREAIRLLPTAIGALSATISLFPGAVDCNSGPDFSTDCVYRPRGFHLVFHSIFPPTSSHPKHFPSALSCIQTIVI